MYVATDQGQGPPDLPRQPAPRRPTTQPEPAKCPRCASTNTKFCYYNNYNKSQPRHFCKSCKRHWTKGGTLRNVPVGGARTKNKRPKIPKAAAKPAAAPAASGEQKGTSSILYRALLGGPPLPRGQTDNGPNTTTDDQFQFSSLSAFEIMSPALNPIEYRYNLDSTEDSSKNYNDSSKVEIPGSSNGSWPGPDTTGSCFDLLPNYWNWSEIEVLASSADHHLNIPWDEVKP